MEAAWNITRSTSLTMRSWKRQLRALPRKTNGWMALLQVRRSKASYAGPTRSCMVPFQGSAARPRETNAPPAAAIQQVTPALEYSHADIAKMLETNYTGVFLSARAVARQMYKYKIQGSICLIASMSGSIANKGFIAPVYNSSKAAVVQLARNLAMEWGRIQPDGSGGIRVNSLSPGHIVTPMVEENFRRGEADRATWEENNMLGRLSTPEEYKAAGLFLLSRASSYMVSKPALSAGLVLTPFRLARIWSSTEAPLLGKVRISSSSAAQPFFLPVFCPGVSREAFGIGISNELRHPGMDPDNCKIVYSVLRSCTWRQQ